MAEQPDGFIGREVIFTWKGNEILGVREKSVAVNGEPVDVTSDENDGWRKLLAVAGQNQVDLSISGVVKDRRIKADWFAGLRTGAVEIEYPDGHVLAGNFFIASFTDTGPYNDAMTFEATLQSTGPVTLTPYT